MERYLRKSAGNGLERGFGPAAMIDRPLQQQSATRSGLKTRNPCSTRPIGRMSRLTEKVKTEIPGETIPAGGSAWWAAAHDQYTGGRKRHLLSITNGLPMAPASPSLSTVEHGLLLFSKLGELWSLGTAASRYLRAGACSSRPRGLPERGHHGWSIGQDYGAWWHSRF